jgi:hypothetical protein
MSFFFVKSKFISRQLMALEEENATLLRNFNAKEEALRNIQV